MNTARKSNQSPQPTSSTRTQFRVCTPVKREGQEKPFWHRIGTGWLKETDKGTRISLRLNSMPFNGELELFEDTGNGPGQATGAEEDQPF